MSIFNTAITYYAHGERGSHVKKRICRGTLYLVPVENASKGVASLRVRPTKNGQIKGMLMTEAYML
ncbi:MAG: hypothetical protein NVS4B1_37470 [Ktedonobacteraceae bacterium]